MSLRKGVLKQVKTARPKLSKEMSQSFTSGKLSSRNGAKKAHKAKKHKVSDYPNKASMTSRKQFQRAKKNFDQGQADERTRRKYQEFEKIKLRHIEGQQKPMHHHSMSEGFNKIKSGVNNLYKNGHTLDKHSARKEKNKRVLEPHEVPAIKINNYDEIEGIKSRKSKI